MTHLAHQSMIVGFRAHLKQRGLEWLAAAVMLSWGITLAWTGDTLDSPDFSEFHRFGLTESFWAAAFGMAGSARIAALYINGRRPKTPYIRIACALLGALSWSQIAWLFYRASIANGLPLGTGPAVYLLLAFAEIYSMFEAAHDARYYNR